MKLFYVIYEINVLKLLILKILFQFSELKKLSEESLTRQPEEVFDIICKLGEGSYGSVYKALHKESDQVLAIKQVPVDTDLQEIIKGTYNFFFENSFKS